jgi:hypothetical protein
MELGLRGTVAVVRRGVTLLNFQPEEGGMAAGEAPIKQAVTWIDDQLRDNPAADRIKLVDEAGRRFDLTPLDTDFLLRHLAERKKETNRPEKN